MVKAPYSWPSRENAKLLGTEQKRLDGAEKSIGKAKYTYDINLKDMLIAKALGSPHAHARIRGIDTAEASQVPGVVDVHVLRQADYEIHWQGDLIAVVAAESEGAAAEGVSKLKVDYEMLPVFVQDDNLEAAQAAERTRPGGGRAITEAEPGDNEDEDEFVELELNRLFDAAAVTLEGYYGIDAITHCCLEPHGSTVYWEGDKLIAYLSTQNVSGSDEGFAGDLQITADDVDVICDYIGGGFGSKFAPDYWGIAAAEISRKTGRPVKFMLDRDHELQDAGCRPSGYIKVKLGADENGVITVWDSHHWGTGGFQGGAVSQGVIPYVLEPKNYRRLATNIATNTGPARAWRAPNHPQGCSITHTAIDDLAAKMGKDSFDVFMANLPNASNGFADLYADQMNVAARLIDWKAKWHPHGKGEANGSIVEGLGMALHTWGGTANTSSCTVRIHPDGGVESFCGTQELGTGTRTACAILVAETLGLPIDAVKVNIGRSTYPFSGASGGSTTIGAISESHRRAAHDALWELSQRVAERLEVTPESLEAVDGRIRSNDAPDKSLSWKEACGLLGMQPLEVTANYRRGEESPLSSSNVGGVQMAHVAVDRETGVVKMKKYVLVQDMGLIVNRLTAASQIYGAAIMTIAYALFEQRIIDPQTGAFLNANMAEYKLPRLGDIGEIVVELYEPDDQRQRGVIGLGEPPVISGGAAISNAVANALGVRVPVLPLTPQRVLDALQQAGRV
ncbi:MAG: xanthine dehydrogenase family protein molybdopterin-binding subunit [Pirellulales bacterium]